MSILKSIKALKDFQSDSTLPLIYSHPDYIALSSEQQKIFHSTSSIIQVKAYAGSGKTTLLKTYATINKTPGLYIVYNESIAKESKSKFPDHIECKTAHSLALSELSLSSQFKHLRSRVSNRIKISDLKDLHPTDYPDSFILEALILFREFCVSSSRSLIEFVQEKTTPQTISFLSKLWHSYFDSSSSIPIEHDTYLKIWSLYPTRKLPYRYIMIDECQDCNPPLFDILLQQHSKLIFVGDPYQSIYSFRGSVNAFKHIPKDDSDIFYLTKTFRFGRKIAALASSIIQESDPNAPNIQSDLESSLQNSIPIGSQHLFLARNNISLLEKMYQTAEQGKTFYCLFETFILNHLNDLFIKFKSSQVKVNNITFLRPHDLLNFLENNPLYSDQFQSYQIQFLSHHFDTWEIIFEKLLKFQASFTEAQIILSTVHKAKGLEFDWVEISNDFPYLYEPSSCESIDEERNLFYVAITRAKKGLSLPYSSQYKYLYNPKDFD